MVNEKRLKSPNFSKRCLMLCVLLLEMTSIQNDSNTRDLPLARAPYDDEFHPSWLQLKRIRDNSSHVSVLYTFLKLVQNENDLRNF